MARGVGLIGFNPLMKFIPVLRANHQVVDAQRFELPSQAWIDRFTLQRKYTKDTLMHAPQWFLADEAFESLDTQSEFA